MSIRLNQVGNTAGHIAATVRNGETSASIPRGTPVVMKLSTTASNSGDGLDVVLPSTAGAAVSSFGRYGVVSDTIATGAYSESLLFGVANYAIITRATRAASTNSWSASGTVASGIALGIDTLNNAFLQGASSDGSLPGAVGGAFLLDSLATVSASASATSDTRTAITTSARVFVKML